MNQHHKNTCILLVTGMSGAGKTSALKSLEDIGFEAMDNVPLSLFGNLVAPIQQDYFKRPIAIGADIRTRDFGAESFINELDRLVVDNGTKVKVLFMDCDDNELRRRYTETRHRHPMATDRPVSDGIAHERQLISRLRERADVIIDTTKIGPGVLKHMLHGHFGLDNKPELTVFITSFSYRQGLPREADLVFDVRFLANPHYDPVLKELTGKDRAVDEYISTDKDFLPFMNALTNLMALLLPRYATEGKSYLTVAIGCTGGRHRSVLVAEKLATWLEKKGRTLHLNHRDLDNKCATNKHKT